MTRSCRGAFLTPALVEVLAAGAARNAQVRTQEARYALEQADSSLSTWLRSEYGIVFGEAVTLISRPADRSVDVSVVDDSGAPVTAAVWQEGGDTTVFCDTSAKPIPITGGDPIHIQVFVETPSQVTDATGPPTDEPSKGTVTAIFRR